MSSGGGSNSSHTLLVALHKVAEPSGDFGSFDGPPNSHPLNQLLLLELVTLLSCLLLLLVLHRVPHVGMHPEQMRSEGSGASSVFEQLATQFFRMVAIRQGATDVFISAYSS
jgi:hypothetical protein